MPEDKIEIVAREYDTERFCIIELSPTSVNFRKPIEEVVKSEGFSVTRDIPMTSNTFPAIDGETRVATICLLYIKGKNMTDAIQEIESLHLVPEDFPVLDVIKRMVDPLLKKGVKMTVCLGKKSVYHYDSESTGNIGLDLEHRHFGMYYSEFGPCEGMWFAFSKKALLQLISHY